MKKIGLISDPHARATPVREALAIFAREQTDEIWCMGDIAGYGTELDETVRVLYEAGCLTVLGNHEFDYVRHTPQPADNLTWRYLHGLPRVLLRQEADTRIYMVHASPPDSIDRGIRLLDEAGQISPTARYEWETRLAGFEHDILIVGHTHQVFAELLGTVLVINPGSTCFNHSCAILVLPERKTRFYALSGASIIPSWNWALETGQKSSPPCR